MYKVLNTILFIVGVLSRIIGAVFKVVNFCLVILGILAGSIKLISGVR